MRLLKILFVFVMLIAPASAATEINIYVDNIGDALFLGVTDANVTLPEGVTAVNGRISGYTSNLTVKQGETWTFAYILAGADLHVTLPEGAVIKSVSSSEISLDRGQISLYAANSVRAMYTIEKVDDNSSNVILIWIIVALVFLVGVVYGWNYLKKHVKSVVKTSLQKKQARANTVVEKQSTEQLKHLLHERENLIIGKLREMGKTKMSYLRKACEMPKASFSRHVHELEKKKLVLLSGDGKNRFIELA